MKHIFTLVLLLLGSATLNAQNPGLVVSELFINPSGNDSNLEWVELIATQNIDFSVTPYTVVSNDNGTATANGWVEGGAISYAFEITSGTVTAGQVVYVGGSGMAPTGVKIRSIDVTTTGGDGFGLAQATSGVFGNGGGKADGLAVFNLLSANITSSTVPVDAVFYGTGIGTAFVSTTTGYQLPVNDLYSGGKLQTNSFFAPDPGAQTVKATGSYNTAYSYWTTARTWSVQNFTNDNASSVTLTTAAPSAGIGVISTATQTKSENAGTATVNVTFSSANPLPAKFVVETATYSSAARDSDYSWTNDTLTIPANTNGTFPFTIDILDDAIAEKTETILVKLRAVSNANTTASNFQIIYVTDNDYVNPTANNELILDNLTSFSNGSEGTNSAEIVAHDPTTNRLYIANSVGAKMDIVDFSNPASPSLIASIPITPYGNINSLTVHNGVVAAAIENTNPQANGFVVFFDANGTYLNKVTVGAMPDMITFNHDFTKVVTACEGEPKTDYTVDPEGSIAIVDITPGIAALTDANVAIADFHAYNGQEATLRAQGIRIFGPGSNTSQDFEPEYITISEDNTTAYVSLQENNAMAVVNLNTATVTNVRSLGTKNYMIGNNAMDASDQSAGTYIASVPVKGLFMPDAIAHAIIGGTEYLFSANEGDSREYTAYSEVTRLSGATLDSTAYPDQAILKSNQFMGRINITKATGDTDGDGDIDDIHVFGGRSFSIWNAQTGALVFDSKDLIEQITATHPTTAAYFNASNTSGAAVAKNRSDDKGPEPEGVATAVINGNHYLFVSMERVGGVMIFNVDNPAVPTYVGYYNNRSFATNGPDRGAEGIIIIKKEDSPNGKDIVILANEISSTLSVYQINTCVDLAGAIFTAATDSICTGNTVQLTATGAANSTYQWFKNNQPVASANGTTLTVSQSGNYQLYVSNSALACADTTDYTSITVLPLPVVVASPDQNVCMGTSVTLNASGAQNYNWNNGITSGVAFQPTATQTYTVIGTNAFGCQNTDQVLVTVNTLPTAQSNADFAICSGETITLHATGAPNVEWDNDVADNTPFSPGATTTFTAIITDANGCKDTTETMVTVHPLPIVDAGTAITLCDGASTQLMATGADTYTWSNSIANGATFVPTTSMVLTVTGTDPNGCSDDAQLVITLNPLPQVNAGSDIEVCAGTMITLNANGADTYNWSNGIQNGVAFSAQTPGIFTVTGTDDNGCQNTDQVQLVVNQLPVVNLGADSTTCSNYGPIVLNAGAGYSNYHWNNNAATQTVSAVLTGTYVVTVTDNNGCAGTDAISLTFDPCLGLTENTIDWSVYPNPATSNVTIQTTGNETFTVVLHDLNGKTVLAETSTGNTHVLNIAHLADGTYLLELTQGDNTRVERIIKN